MQNIRSVCVYCASRDGVEPDYKTSAYTLGKIMAEQDIHLVYGGGTLGLMGAVADGALKNGGTVTGVIPKDLMKKEGHHQDLTEHFIVDNMHVRKMMMAKKADAIVILPGGLGTRDELFEILTWKQLGFHDKPIVFVNTLNYWKLLKEDIEYSIKQGFAEKSVLDLMQFVDTPEEVLDSLKTAPEPRWPEHIEDAVPHIFPEEPSKDKKEAQ